MIAMTNRLNRRFANNAASIRALGDVGLGLARRAGPVKATPIRTAAGI